MTQLDLQNTPHRRLNPLTGEWVLVSPQRTERPWLGKVEGREAERRPEYDPDCYLCPGNARAGGARNPDYAGTFVFENDYPALLSDTPATEVNEDGLIVAQSERGNCRVVCFSHRHDLTIARMSPAQLRPVVDTWAEQYLALAGLPWVRHVQIFENCGALMGASNPHPHCQVWANATVPDQAGREGSTQLEHYKNRASCLLCNYLQLELEHNHRLVCENEGFAAVVPYWAVWPFETLLLSKRHFGSIDGLTPAERDQLAEILKQLTTRYDNLFEVPFPYSMGFHQRPTDGQPHPEWHFHAHYYPPLLRSATVQKFMVGYEMLASPQRDLTPESAARRLREVSPIHYAERR